MSAGGKPRVLILNDYPVDHVEGGGAQRIRSLYAAMTDRFDFHLLCLTDALELSEISLSPGVLQTAVPKSSHHRRIQALMQGLSEYSVADVLSLIWCGANDPLRSTFRQLSREADVLVFEHVYMAPLRAMLSREIPVVYSAQNVEYLLKTQLLASHPFAADLLEGVAAAEGELLRTSDGVVAVSNEDAGYFRVHSERAVIVAGNGIEPSQFLSPDPVKPQPPEIVFVGSRHPPNVEAMRFIVSTLAPRFSEALFRVIGSVSDGFVPDAIPDNVDITGVISQERKAELLRSATVAVNPMFSGSGSNLKLAEYFAGGVPVVSTAFGARGYHVSDGVHLRIAGEDSFPEALEALLHAPEERTAMAESARRLAERELCWSAFGSRYADFLVELLGGKA